MSTSVEVDKKTRAYEIFQKICGDIKNLTQAQSHLIEVGCKRDALGVRFLLAKMIRTVTSGLGHAEKSYSNARVTDRTIEDVCRDLDLILRDTIVSPPWERDKFRDLNSSWILSQWEIIKAEWVAGHTPSNGDLEEARNTWEGLPTGTLRAYLLSTEYADLSSLAEFVRRLRICRERTDLRSGQWQPEKKVDLLRQSRDQLGRIIRNDVSREGRKNRKRQEHLSLSGETVPDLRHLP